MNRKNLSVAVVLAVLLTLAVGYALFSQTINITGTATAQGSFSYNIQVQKGINEEAYSDDVYEIGNEFGSTGTYAIDFYTSYVGSEPSSASILNTGNNVTYSVNFTKPRQRQFFTIKVTNTGTIDMEVNYIDFVMDTPTPTGTITGKSGTVYDVSDVEKCVNKTITCADNFILADTQFSITRNDLTLVFVNERAYNEVAENTEDPSPSVIIKPNESIYFIIRVVLNDVQYNSAIKEFNITSTNNINLVFNQATN